MPDGCKRPCQANWESKSRDWAGSSGVMPSFGMVTGVTLTGRVPHMKMSDQGFRRDSGR